MGFLDKIKENRQSTSGVTNPAQWLVDMFNPNSTAGPTVTEEKAMEHSAVYAAVRVISETIASLPLNVYRERDDGGKEKAKDNYLYPLLHNKPNDLMTSFTWREVMMAHLLLWGNHYSLIEEDRSGKIESIWPLMPDRMQVKERNRRLYYVYHPKDSEQIIYDQQEILHIPGLGFDGRVGKSVISMAREAVGLGLAAEEFGARFFSQGAQPGGIVEYPQTLSDEAYERYKREVRDEYQGLSKAHKVMVLEEGMSYTQTGIPPDDAQFLETRKFQIEEIARIFRVPPHMLADLDRATFSNIEQQSIDFVTNTIRPWLVRIEQTLNDKLISQRNYSNYIKFVVEGLLRGDAESRASFYNQMFNIGAMSINDIREKEDMNPVDNGDQNFVPLNMLPLDQASEEMVEENSARCSHEHHNHTPGKQQSGEHRSSSARRRLRERWEGRIESAADRVVQKEINKIQDAMNKELKNQRNFEDEIVEFYEEFPEEIQREMQPTLFALADAVAEEAGAEVDFNDYDIEEFKQEYIENFALSHAGYSRGQLLALMDEADSLEEATELVEDRLDDWNETRADKVATEQSVRVEGAVAREVFAAAGVTRLVWVTDADPCPICEEMGGTVVGVEQNFLDTNETIQEQGGYSAEGPKAHPPLHQACVCTIEPQ